MRPLFAATIAGSATWQQFITPNVLVWKKRSQSSGGASQKLGSRPIAPSSKVALYLGALIAVYVIRDPVLTIGFGAAAIAVALAVILLLPDGVTAATMGGRMP